MLPKSIKMGPHGLLGGVWGPSWPQEPKSPSKVRSTPLRPPPVGGPNGGQNRPKSIKNRLEIDSKIH